MVRIRTINQTLQMIRQEDPKSSISKNAIRELADNRQIRSLKRGNRVLIDYDSLLAYLNSETYSLPMEQIIL